MIQTIILITIVVAIWYYIKRYRPAHLARQDEAWQQYFQKEVEKAAVQEARTIVKELNSSPLMERWIKILDGYEKIISNESFGKLIDTELVVQRPMYNNYNRGYFGAIKLIVDRDSGYSKAN